MQYHVWLHNIRQLGAGEILITSVDREGTRKGFDIELVRTVAAEVNVPVIASGGIATVADVEALCAVEAEGITGAITGRAIYEGTLDFATAQARADELNGAA